jgi:glycosyltransferase involved in cell wall biosynthesis
MNTPNPVLLVAYQCGPGMGSVSQIGWEWFSGMAAQRPVTLLTHVRNRAAIEAAPDKPPAEIIYVDTEWFAGPLYRLAKRLFPRSEHSVFLVSQLDYFLFDFVALRQLKAQLRHGATWRLLHIVTPVTLSAPTLLGRLGLPMVRGPLNCGLPLPSGFPEILQREGSGLARLRVLPAMVEALLGSLRGSAAILVATKATRAAVPVNAQHRCVPMLENAVDLTRFTEAPALAPPSAESPLRISFVGRLVPFKALQLLLQALAELRSQGVAVQLTVAGSGPMEAEWRQLCTSLGLDACVQWLGNVPLQNVAKVMQDSHVFCLPSIRESGGAVLLEAMACARPVIGLDFGGPGEVVDEDVGWKLPMPNAAGVVQGLVRVLREAAEQPEQAAAKGRRGRDRVVARYTWPAKLREASALYDRLIQAPTAPHLEKLA